MEELNLEDPTVSSQLDEVERSVREELDRLGIADVEAFRAVTLRGLVVERETYQELSDDGLLPPPVTRLLLREVDDYIEELSLVENPMDAVRGHERGRPHNLTR